ncbi:YbdK family carboxylate-amine ligase [Arthrobacter sp. H35-D1]|uniref:carboxylate-amine ligase n=1 Tax=Arthrobacter sp. H35-D1 TaxID=3046202 RepID=UPI0024B9ED87|nr:YbdK family carboxylate-amine ligase [Arthrobacter sp. H35-D1]MDJ0315434.1 YbdK family carboxylate-amine ligase [Arthrobacter sp. H35-D1]
MLSFGIEEEFVLLDAARLRPVNDAPECRDGLSKLGFGAALVHQEFFQSQLEFASPVYTELSAAAEGLLEFRWALKNVAATQHVVAAGVGTPYDVGPMPVLTPGERYEQVAANVRALAWEHQINGLHVHVGVPGRAAGVVALNGVRRWLPVLLALSANSPLWGGHDTGYASWRAIHSRRWTTAGCPPPFTDDRDYDRRIRALSGIGATSDPGTIAWYARLSERQPTLEFRVADAQLDSGVTVLLAALCRALVATALHSGTSRNQPAPELLDAALWHAARDGLSRSLVHPVTGLLVPASDAVQALLEETRHQLLASGDLAEVETLLRDTTTRGSGAERQRQALATGGLPGLVLLLESELTRTPAGLHRSDQKFRSRDAHA